MPESRDGSVSFWREAGSAFAFVFRTPLAIFLVYNLTFVIWIFAMYGADLQGLAYLHSRQTNLWRMLTALAPSSWVTTLVILVYDFEQSRSAWPRTWRARMTVVLCTALGLSLTVLPLISQYIAWKEEPLIELAFARAVRAPGLYPRIFIASTLALTTATLLASGVIGVHTQLIDRLAELRHRATAPETGLLDEDVRWYQRQEARLKRFLTLCAIVIGSSSLSVGAMRHLLNQAISPPPRRSRRRPS